MAWQWPPRRRFFLIPRRRSRSEIIRSQVNPPYPITWRRPFLVALRSIAPRRARRFEIVRPQVNPPLPPVWWRRPFIATLRSIGPRRARRFEVVPPQVNPPMPPTWWKRPILLAARSLAPRRAKRFEITPPQFNPLYAVWPNRLRRAVVSLRRRLSTTPSSEPGLLVAPMRRRPTGSRRGKASLSPWSPVSVIAPLFAVRLRRAVGILRRRPASAAISTPDPVAANRLTRARVRLRRRTANSLIPPSTDLPVALKARGMVLRVRGRVRPQGPFESRAIAESWRRLRRPFSPRTRRTRSSWIPSVLAVVQALSGPVRHYLTGAQSHYRTSSLSHYRTKARSLYGVLRTQAHGLIRAIAHYMTWSRRNDGG